MISKRLLLLAADASRRWRLRLPEMRTIMAMHIYLQQRPPEAYVMVHAQFSKCTSMSVVIMSIPCHLSGMS